MCQFSSVAQSCLTLCDPWTAACQASLSITNSQSLLRLMSDESMMPSNHLILCCPLLLLPSTFPASGFFQMSQLFASGGQSIGISASTSVLPMNTQDRSPLEWTGWVSLHFLFQWLLGILAWKIPWTEEPGGLQCRGLQRI